MPLNNDENYCIFARQTHTHTLPMLAINAPRKWVSRVIQVKAREREKLRGKKEGRDREKDGKTAREGSVRDERRDKGRDKGREKAQILLSIRHQK